MRTNLHHLLEQTAHQRGGSPALTYRDVTVSYAELWRTTSLAARGLQALGLARDDRVGIYLDKRIETVAAIFGTSAAKGVFVPINHILKAPQVGYILRDCDVRVLVTSQDRLDLLREELNSCNFLEHVVLVDAHDELPADGRDIRCMLGLTWSPNAPTQLRPQVLSAVDLDMAAILYTSGSTGKPKGVVLSHRNLIVGAESVSSYLENRADDVILSALPLSFDAGFSQLTTAFAVGAHVILLNYLLPGDLVKLCAAHKVTGLTCVPPLWLQIADLEWPAEATAASALLREHRRADAEGDPRPTAEDLPTGGSLSDVRADRSFQVDISGSRPGRQAT